MVYNIFISIVLVVWLLILIGVIYTHLPSRELPRLQISFARLCHTRLLRWYLHPTTCWTSPWRWWGSWAGCWRLSRARRGSGGWSPRTPGRPCSWSPSSGFCCTRWPRGGCTGPGWTWSPGGWPSSSEAPCWPPWGAEMQRGYLQGNYLKDKIMV